MAKLGLGKGLGALLDEENTETVQERKLPAGVEADADGQLWIKPELLKPNPHQPRQEFDEESLSELAESIRENGIVQAVTVEAADNGDFYIIAGERRTKAAMLAGLEKIPVQLRKYSDEKKLEIALIENIQRADLNPIEEAQAFKNLMMMAGITQDEVARRVGKNRSTVANALRLLELPDDIQGALVGGKISAGHARTILSVDGDTDRHVLYGRIVGGGLSVREAEAAAKEMNGEGTAQKADKSKKSTSMNIAPQNPEIAALEAKFREALGTKVTLKGALDGGFLQIEYFSAADLDRLYNLIVSKTQTEI